MMGIGLHTYFDRGLQWSSASWKSHSSRKHESHRFARFQLSVVLTSLRDQRGAIYTSLHGASSHRKYESELQLSLNKPG